MTAFRARCSTPIFWLMAGLPAAGAACDPAHRLEQQVRQSLEQVVRRQRLWWSVDVALEAQAQLRRRWGWVLWHRAAPRTLDRPMTIRPPRDRPTCPQEPRPEAQAP